MSYTKKSSSDLSEEVKIDQIIHKIREIFGKPVGMIPLHAPVFIGYEKK